MSGAKKELPNVVLPGGIEHGSVVQCRVLAVVDGHYELSLRPSRLVGQLSIYYDTF